ncbi:serine hydrolase domain-containing protein [Angustibacter sp. McL0619]|uniref:serine hydrolase domain-containing protein n=1 Tax=Angustibacter sp. McL0619 TaxID=3415676 RepID=UPI003CFAF902
MAAAPAQETWSTRCAALDDALGKALAEARLVGAVLIVMQGGEIVYRRAVGLADRESHRPMTVDTLFRYSSLTKPIVAAAALVLVEQGTLELHEPVTRWIRTFRPSLADGTPATISIHHLLTHTSGLSYPFNEASPDGPYHQADVCDGIGSSGLTLDENVARIASAPLDFAPGESWQYSVSTDVLGSVIEHATGEALPSVVSRLVTEPLGMNDTAFQVADRARLAAAYGDGTPEPLLMGEGHVVPGSLIEFSPGRAFDPTAFPSGGAGMIGSAPDFVHFLELIRTGGGPILTPATAALMMGNQLGDLTVDDRPGEGHSYGGSVIMDPDAAGVPHSPGTCWWGGIYGHRWFVDPTLGVTLALLTNTAIEGLFGKLADDVVAATRT